MLITASCDQESANSNTDCQLQSFYKLDFFSGDAAKAFNISSNIPIEIQNQTVGYGLFNQWIANVINLPVPYPYTEYFIETIEFVNDSLAFVKLKYNDSTRDYNYAMNKCQIELESWNSKLKIELSNSGKDLSEQRYAIYEYKLTNLKKDTFLFIEFRNVQFSSYEDVIKIFAMENKGKYDSVAVERIRNKTIK